MEEEQSRVQELVANTQARLGEQTWLLEQVSPRCVLCPGQAPGWVRGVSLAHWRSLAWSP